MELMKEWIEILANVFGLGAILFTVVRGAFRIDRIIKEVEPNSGDSMNDRVTRLEQNDKEKMAKLTELNTKTDAQTTILYELRGAMNATEVRRIGNIRKGKKRK